MCCSFPIPSLRKSSCSFLDLLRSFSSSKRLFTFLFNALSSFDISVFFSLEDLNRSLALCIALLQTFKPLLILFRSSWNNESVVWAISFCCKCFNSCCKLLIFSRSSLITSTVTDMFPCLLLPATTTFKSLEVLWQSISQSVCFKFEIILQNIMNKNDYAIWVYFF